LAYKTVPMIINLPTKQYMYSNKQTFMSFTNKMATKTIWHRY